MNQEAYIVTESSAPQIANWLANRGGIAIWKSIDLSDPGKSYTTPVRDALGNPASKPHWSVENTPSRIITDPADVVVSRDVEVKRFHVAVRMGAQGLKLKVTDAGSRRIRRELMLAGDGSYYSFDYAAYDNCIILKPESRVLLVDFIRDKGLVEKKIA